MKENWKNFKKNKVLWLIVIGLLFAGIFFRTYRYHDLLRFNADQGRDCEVVSNFIDGKTPLPLLGPKAGGTTFKLGPIFYYFEIISAKIFGNYPDKMAYFDLILSILCIPLLYLFLRKYFELDIALLLTLIFAVSQFAIRWARFAWNINSTPFWTLLALYSIYEIVSQKNNNKICWAIISGITIGVCVQLHTMLLLFLPITLVLFAGYLIVEKNKNWKYLIIIFPLVLILNTPQFISEHKTNGQNTMAFFGGIQKKESSQGSLIKNFIYGNSAIAQIMPNILTGYEIADDFRVNFDYKHTGDVAIVIFGTLFTLSGIFLASRYYKKEVDTDKKLFLLLLSVYFIVAYFIYIKLALEVSVRMYLVIFFVPYFLLGFWLQFLREKIRTQFKLVKVFIIITFILVNIFFIKKYFAEFIAYSTGNGSVNISTLGEMEKFSQFIAHNADGANKIYISGDKKFFFINYLPIKYLLGRSRIELFLAGKNDVANQEKIFYIVRENKLKALNSDPVFSVVRYQKYGKFTMLLLRKK